jgi:GntR family transcriptional repressor for pyruvate dehydrogenase complex
MSSEISLEAPTKTIQRERVHAIVASSIEAQILSGSIRVGDKLPSEGAIAKEFGVSTRSVREAIQTLETKGLVQRRHGGLTTVIRANVDEYLETLATTIRLKFANDPEYLFQLMAARRMLEAEVAQGIDRQSSDALVEVESALKAMEMAAKSNDKDSFIRADAQFHYSVIRLGNNNVITTIYDNLFGLINEVIQVTSRVPSKPLDEAYAEHLAIFECLRDGKGTEARELLQQHIQNSATYLRLVLR